MLNPLPIDTPIIEYARSGLYDQLVEISGYPIEPFTPYPLCQSIHLALAYVVRSDISMNDSKASFLGEARIVFV